MEENKHLIKINQNKLKTIINENLRYYYDALLNERKDNNLLDDFDCSLNEVRGIIDNLSQLITYLGDKFNTIILDESLLKKYYIGFNEGEQVYEYQFEIIVDSNNVDTLFMINPKFKFNVFISNNNYSDLKRNIGDSYYVGTTNPEIDNKNGELKIINPEFVISVNLSKDLSYATNYFYSHLRHEITHCKRNLHEFINNPEKLHKRYQNEILYNQLDNDDEIEHLIKRCLYLMNNDEINARSHQIYSELDETFKNPFLIKLKQYITRTEIYQNFIDEIDKYITILKYNLTNELLSKTIRNIIKINKKNTVTYLLNGLIIAKNKQLSGFQKVAEQWQYEKLKNKI